MRILIIEDDTDLAAALVRNLSREGYVVDLAFDGEEASDLAAVNAYDVTVLDLNLPSIDGLEVLRLLRAQQPRLPVLILTSRGTIGDRVIGLDVGADDYLTKPFDLRELAARIRSLVRRDMPVKDSVFHFGDLTLDPAARIARKGEDLLRLTRKEFSVLEYLMWHPGEVISQERLLEHVWGDEVDPFTNVVRVHINSLRRKLQRAFSSDPHHIETVIGKGYRMALPKSSGKE